MNKDIFDTAKPIPGVDELALHHQRFFSYVETSVSQLLSRWNRTKSGGDFDGNLIIETQKEVDCLVEYASIMDHPALYAQVVRSQNTIKGIRTEFSYNNPTSLDDAIAKLKDQFTTLLRETKDRSQNLSEQKLNAMFSKLGRLTSLNMSANLSNGTAIFTKYAADIAPCHTDFEGFGYTIYEPLNLTELKQLYEKNGPQMLIMDDEIMSDPNAKEFIIGLKKRFGEQLRLILISNSDSFESELNAVRLQANQRLQRPIDRMRLVDIFRNTSNIRSISLKGVCANPIQAINDYIEYLFNLTGTNILKIDQPDTVSKAVRDHEPDFVILSNSDPVVSAVELATIIRYDRNNSAICIHELSNTPAVDVSPTGNRVQKSINQTLRGPIDPVQLILRIVTKTLEFYSAVTKQLSFEEDLLDALGHHSIVSITDRAGIIEYANDKFCEVSQYSRDELIGKNHSLLESGEHPRAFFRDLWRTVSSGDTWQGIIRNQAKDGSFYWVDTTIHPVVNSWGVAYRYISIRTVITDSVLMKKKYEEQHNELQLIFDSAPTLLYFFDSSGTMLRVNKAVERAFGVPAEKIVGLPLSNLFQPDDASRISKLYNQVIDTGKPIYNALEPIQVNHESHWVSADLIPLKDSQDQVTGVLTFANDITNLIESQQALTLSQERLQKSQAFAKIGSWDFDCTHEVIHISDAFFDILDIPRSHQGEGLSEEIFSMVHPDDQAHYRALYNDAIAGNSPNGFAYEYRAILKNGTTLWLSLTANTTRDADGSNIHVMGVTRDITDETLLMQQRDEYEHQLISAKDEAIAANKAKSIFLSNMSHELRTPLNAILGFSQLLLMERDPENPSAGPCYPQEIFNAGQHLLDLINDILDLARIESGKQEFYIEKLGLTKLLSETIGLVEPLISDRFLTLNIHHDGITQPTDSQPPEVAVFADVKKLKQVLLNLLSNAIKYNRPGGQIDVHIETNLDKQIYIGISDSGAGLTEQQQSQLFKPFSRLSNEPDEVEGTGIGLVITKRLIEQMGGSIGVKSAVNQGSTFWIKIPSSATAIEQNVNLEEPVREEPNDDLRIDLPPTPTSTVIYVETNDTNLHLVSNIFKSRPSTQLISTDDPPACMALTVLHKPDLIILSDSLDESARTALLTELNNVDAIASIPRVSIGSRRSTATTDNHLEEGFAHHISQPINILDLLNTIDGLIEPGTQI